MGNIALGNALSGVQTSQGVLDVISNNVSNASDKDYSRQKALVKSNRPIFQNGKFFGTGVNLEEVTRQHSEFIGERLRTELQSLGRFEKLDTVLQEVETIVGEPSEDGIRGTFSQLNKALQNLANNPENRGARTDLVGKAASFANTMKRVNRQFQKLAGDKLGTINDQIEASVGEVNNLAKQIASLNINIAESQSRGGNPNDLLDERDALVKDLTRKIDAEVVQGDDNFRVTVSGYTLVQGAESHELEFGSKQEGESPQLLYDNPSKSKIQAKSGELKALFDLRDEVIPGFVNQLNDLAVQYIDRFNDKHQAGFGLDGQERSQFFSDLPTRNSGVYRLEGMGDLGGSIEKQRGGYIDSPDTVLAGDNSTNEPENFEEDQAVSSFNSAGEQIGNPTGKLEINDSVISYDMTEDTIKDVINRINEADNQAEAYLSAENRLVIKGSQSNEYQIDSMSDTGLLLDKTNIMRVGGSNRTASQSIGDATTAITAASNFQGDKRIDAEVDNSEAGAPREIDLAEGTLQFESFNSDGFQVNYDGRDDSLRDIVSRINNRAQTENSKVRAGINKRGQLQMFGYENSQSVSVTGAPGETTVSVSDISEFSEGKRVGFSDSSNGEITTVKDIDRSAGEITVDLARNYTGPNAQVTTDFDNKFRVNDEASQQIENTLTVGDGTDDDVSVKDASVFNLGDEVSLSTNDGSDSVSAKITSIDLSNDEITIEDTGAGPSVTFSAGDAAIQKSADTNRNRSLLSVLGMDRKLSSEQPATEFAVEGTKKRPPLAEQVAGFEVNDRIRNNPDLIAAAQGVDQDLDGVAEVTNGPGDGSNAQNLSALSSEKILNSGTKNPDEEINTFITGVGSAKSLASREKSASEKLVKDIQEQRQQISGVNIDQELTEMIQQQQLFQASSRIIQTVQQLNQSLLQVV
ncbi:MAG: flagellar hook-associated protein FlgK [bacterium]